MGDPLGVFEQGSAQVDQAATLTKGQGNLLDQLTDLLSGQLGKGVTPFQGQRVAGFGDLQNQAFDAFGGLGGLGQSLLGIGGQQLSAFDPSQSQGFLGQAQNALTQGLQGVDTQAISDAFAPSRQLALNQFQQQMIPNLLERFGASSGGSGALQQQLAQAGGNLSLGLSAQQAPFVGQAALQAPGQQFQGAGLAGNLAQLPGQLAGQGAQFGAQGSDLLSQLLGVGGQQQQQQQNVLSAQQQQFQEGQSFNNPFLNFLGIGLGTPAFENIVTPPGPTIAEQLAPAAGAAAGACDKRLKENEEPIDNALEKVKELTGYTYNYKGVNRRNAGIMAQDLESVLPEGIEEVEGIKMVRWDSIVALLANAINELAERIGD